MKKLVLFGDSLFGRFGKERIEALEASLPGYDVYNCAAGGWNSDDCVKKAAYIATLKPDLLAISLGTNDLAPWKHLELPTFVENVQKIINSFPDSVIIYFLPPPVNENKESAHKKILNESAKLYHDAAKEVCINNNVQFIDSRKVFLPLLAAGTDYHVEDGIHLNDLAYEIITKELAALINNE
jgi:lysophospholipase L1-like esterase